MGKQRPTPEVTHLVATEIGTPHFRVHLVAKAEQLERERDDERDGARLLREQIRVADVAFNHLNTEASQLRARVAELEKDKARWIAAAQACLDIAYANPEDWRAKIGQAIDATTEGQS